MKRIFKYISDRTLSHIIRFNRMTQHFPEDVAEHSFYTAHFTQILCDLLAVRKIKIDALRAISMALLHDQEEALTGDIITPTKRGSEKISEAIDELNKDLIKLRFEGLPESLARAYVKLWLEEEASQTIEAQIVKVADKLSLIAKCFEEIEAGNSYFEEIYKEQFTSLKKLDYPWWKKIRSSVLPETKKNSKIRS